MAVGDELSAATAAHWIGFAGWYGRDLTSAEPAFRRALAIRRRLAPRSRDLAITCSCLGNVQRMLGEGGAGIELLRLSVDLQLKLAPGSLNLAMSQVNLGGSLAATADLDGAQEQLEQARTIFDAIAPGSRDAAQALSGLGTVARSRGMLDAAEAYEAQALRTTQKLEPDSPDVADLLTDLGNTVADAGRTEEAAAYYSRSLAIFKKAQPDSLDVAAAEINLGAAEFDLGRLDIAERYLRDALTRCTRLAPSHELVANILDDLAAISFKRGALFQADEQYSQASKIWQMLAPDTIDVASNMHNRSMVLWREGKRPAAKLSASRAWDIIRKGAVRLSGDASRQSYERKYSDIGTRLANMQVLIGDPSSAIATLEEGRALALEQLMLDRRLAEARGGGPLWDAYRASLRRRDSAQRAVSAAALARAAAERSESHEGLVQTTEALRQATLSLAQLTAEGERRWSRVRDANRQAVPLPLALSKARHSLPPGAVFVAFSVDDDQSCILLVNRTGDVHAWPLGIGAKSLAAEVERYRALVSRDIDTPGAVPRPARRGAEPVGRGGADSAQALAGKLFKQLFPLPARTRVLSAQRVVISPDGALHDLPFAALITGRNGKGEPKYLGLEKPLCYAPSLTVWAQTRGEPHPPATVSRQAHMGLSVLVVGDPLFDEQSREQSAAAAPAPPVVDASTRASASATSIPGPSNKLASRPRRMHLWNSDTPPPRLPYTRSEAQQVAALYGAAPLLDRDATEQNVRTRIGGAAIIHLATHGYLHQSMPMESGILLTPPSMPVAPSQGPGARFSDKRTENDGALQAWEIASQLHLQAEVAVLSACDTARGSIAPGEGVNGLSRSLEVAGCRSVVVSQWSVADKSTAQLMVAFHRGMAHGLAKDEALRRAMETVAAQSSTAAPYYWAPFILLGDPDPLPKRLWNR